MKCDLVTASTDNNAWTCSYVIRSVSLGYRPSTSSQDKKHELVILPGRYTEEHIRLHVVASISRGSVS